MIANRSVRTFESVLGANVAIMVARGDLLEGVEIPFNVVAEAAVSNSPTSIPELVSASSPASDFYSSPVCICLCGG